jgi:hypothetical protein
LNRATGDRKSIAEFYQNGPSYPLPATKQEGPLAEYRSEEQWHHETHEAMESFLDFDDATKKEIYDWQLSQMRRLAARHNNRRGGNRHQNSLYILSGILREKHEKWSLTGSKRRTRCYRASRAFNRPKTGYWLNRCFNADVLEAPIKPILKQVLSSYSGIVGAMQSAANDYLCARQAMRSELPTLLAQKNQLLAQLEF